MARNVIIISVVRPKDIPPPGAGEKRLTINPWKKTPMPVQIVHLSKAAEIGMPPVHVQGLPASPPAIHAASPHAEADTHTLHSINGAYHPERAALHDKIVNHYMSGGEHADLHKLYQDHADNKAQKIGVFTMGGGGSGKSYYSKNKFLKHPRFVQIDPDDIKEHLPEYNPRKPEHVHEESSHIAKRLYSDTLNSGKSFLYDGTGANKESFEKKLKQAKDAGYQVHLHYVAVPLETAKKRNAARTRQVPEHVLEAQHAAVKENFHAVKHLADKAKVIDNSAENVSPYRSKRMELLKQKAQMEKAMGHAQHAEIVEIHLKGNHTIEGTVKDGFVYVRDIIHDGHSERAITGQRPGLKPIAVAKLKEMGATFVHPKHARTSHR